MAPCEEETLREASRASAAAQLAMGIPVEIVLMQSHGIEAAVVEAGFSEAEGRAARAAMDMGIVDALCGTVPDPTRN